MLSSPQHIGGFVIVSAIMHAAVLGNWATTSSELSLHRAVTVLDVEMTAPMATPKPSSPRAQPAPRIQDKIKATSEPANIEPAAATAMEASPSPATRMIMTNPDTGTNELSAEKIQQTLRIELARYFSYPEAARRRNWQGDVVLEFNILENGQLSDIRVQHSSGYRALDEAALYALQQIEPQPALAQLTSLQQRHRLPVSYRLQHAL